jgi:lipoate-protein ligase A
MPTSCRLVIDPPARGAWNMAVDEVLLGWSAEKGRCCLRFYQWSEPTLSLGYFQRYEDRRLHPPSLGCPVVRRISGGGAILHDDELTYSLVVPRPHPLAARAPLLYRTVHTTLIEALADLGLAGHLHEQPRRRAEERQPFLCFQRRAPGDVLVGDTKVAGSAQRRRQAVLQHGSLLLGRSAAAPELDGLAQLLGVPVRGEEIARRWLTRLADRLRFVWAPEALCDKEKAVAREIAQKKYESGPWTKNRGRT